MRRYSGPRHFTAGCTRPGDPIDPLLNWHLVPQSGKRNNALLALTRAARLASFLYPSRPGATHAVPAVRSRERRRYEILRRMRHPSRSFVRECGACNPPKQKFCGECGARLERGASSRQVPSPDAYTPKYLAEKILTSRTALEGERKQVTVLFADLKGSMELLADRDPEPSAKPRTSPRAWSRWRCLGRS